jgi:hypothetical protein
LQAKRPKPLKYLKISVVIFIISVGLILGLFNNASAAGEDAEFNSIDLTATPQVQGMGGEIVISVRANFFGGCCYHLYAYDVKAELEVPSALKITSALPGTIKEVDAKPGGQATTERFQWRITGNIPGTYGLNVTVTTSNCGSITDSISVTITEGASISNPDIYPQRPSVDEDISVSVEVQIGREGLEIQDSTIYVLSTKNKYDVQELFAENETLYLKNEADEGSEIATLGEGNDIAMEPVSFTDKWRVKLAGFKETEVYLWFVVTTDDGTNTTSSVYNLEVEDIEYTDYMVFMTTWTTFFILLVGVILIIGGWLLKLKRVEKLGTTRGIFPLGGKYYRDPYRATTPELHKLQKQLDRYRNIVIVFVIVIAIAFVIWAVYSGLFTELFDRTLEG